MRDCGRETTRDNCRSDLISATNVNASSTANVKICVDSSMTDIKAGLRPVICECSRRTMEREWRLEVELPIFRGRSFPAPRQLYSQVSWKVLSLYLWGAFADLSLHCSVDQRQPIVKPLICMAGAPLKPLMNWTCIPNGDDQPWKLEGSEMLWYWLGCHWPPLRLETRSLNGSINQHKDFWTKLVEHEHLTLT